MAIFYLIYLLFVLLAPLLNLTRRKKCKCCKKCYRVKNCSKKLSNSVFWGSLITLLNESYMIFIICIMINLPINSMESQGQRFMSISCVFCLCFIILVPMRIICQLWCKFSKLGQKSMKQKYGTLYEDLRLKSGRMVLMQPTFFLVRRVLLGVAICLVNSILIW